MKKTILTCLVLMAIGLCLFVSCNAEQALPDLEDGVAYIKFGDNSRGLSPSYEAAEYKDLYWFYTASKDDDYGTTGAISTDTPVKTTTEQSGNSTSTPDKGLDIDGYLGPFSQGDWIFNLYAYRELDENESSPKKTTLIYSAKNIKYTLKGGESKSIPVTVYPEGSEGTVEFDEANFVYETSGKAAPTLTLVAESTENIGESKVTYTFSTAEPTKKSNNYYQLELKSNNQKDYSIGFKDTSTTEAKLKVREDGQATYKCDVTVTIPNDKGSFTELTNTFYFGVYSGGATTTISGNLLEDPSAMWKFDVAEYVLKTVDYSELTTENGVNVGNTTMSFANAKGLDQNATYTLKVTEKDSAELNDDFVINSGSDDNNSIQKVYNLSLVDTTTGEEKKDFKQDDGGYVTVTLFAGTGLNGDNDYYKSGNAPSGHTHAKGSSAETTSTTTCTVTVRYNGTGSQPELVSYCAESGYVTITTEHFSEFVVIDTSKLPVSVTYTTDNTSETKYYTSLEGAFKAVNESKATSISMELINDVTLSNAVAVNRSVALDLKEKGITVNGGYISVGEGATLTVSGGTTGQSNFVVGTAGDSEEYTHAVASTVSGGKTTYHGTLEKAIEAANSATAATTINVLEDINLTETITVSTEKPITLDLGGNTVYGTKLRVFLVQKGELTIKNGTVKAKTYISSESTEENIGNSVIKLQCDNGDATVTLAGDARVIAENCYGITAFTTKKNTGNKAKINVYGAIISANPCLSGLGVDELAEVTMNVYSGASLTQDKGNYNWDNSTTDYDPSAIYQPNDGELNIYGGTITSKNGSAIEIRRGVANISGGTIKSEVETFVEDFKNSTGDGPTTRGAAVAVNYYGIGVDTAKNGLVVNITGGTFEGAKQLALVKVRNYVYGDATVKAVVSNVDLEADKIVGVKDGASDSINGTYYPVSTWDGTTVDTSWYTYEKEEFTLTTAAQLAGLASLVNGGTNESSLSTGNTFSDVTIKLDGNIDLNNKGWTPIGLYHNISDTNFTKKEFSGTFDGQNHTISGLMISCDNGRSSYRALFGYVKDGTIKNLTVKGAVNACDSAGVVGALCGGTIKNVTNKVNVSVSQATPQGLNSNDKPQAKVAGIVVTVKDGNESTITNCRNEGVISSTDANGTSAVGGIVAWSMTKKLTVTDCTNSGNVSTAGTQWAGGIIGYVKENSVNTTVSNCTNTGTVTAGTDITAGGIIGRIVKGAKGTKSGNKAGTGYEEVGGDKNDFVSPDSN